jgi:hypothetical protein
MGRLQCQSDAGQAQPLGNPVAAKPGGPRHQEHVGVPPGRLQDGGVDVPRVLGDQPDEPDAAHRPGAALLPPLPLLRRAQQLRVARNQAEAEPAAGDEALERPVGGDRNVMARSAQRGAETGDRGDVPARPDRGDQDPHPWPPFPGDPVSGGAGRRVAASNRPATSRP